jgi:hypothetical protein
VYVPGVVYVFVGLVAVLCVPSPKNQVLLPGPGVEVFVNATGAPAQEVVVLCVKAASRLPMETKADIVSVSLQPAALVAISLTV